MKFIFITFFILYFNEFFNIIINNKFESLNSNLLVWGISHYEGWIIIISFILLFYYVQNNVSSKDQSIDNSHNQIFNLFNLLVLKKLILRKRYLDQLHLLKFILVLIQKFQHDLHSNLSLFELNTDLQIRLSVLKKLQFFNIYTSRNYMNRLYLL